MATFRGRCLRPKAARRQEREGDGKDHEQEKDPSQNPRAARIGRAQSRVLQIAYRLERPLVILVRDDHRRRVRGEIATRRLALVGNASRVERELNAQDVGGVAAADQNAHVQSLWFPVQ